MDVNPDDNKAEGAAPEEDKAWLAMKLVGWFALFGVSVYELFTAYAGGAIFALDKHPKDLFVTYESSPDDFFFSIIFYFLLAAASALAAFRLYRKIVGA